LARALIVGCGCRGRHLGERLLAQGWAVRGTSRSEPGRAAIAEAGLEAAQAEPARPGTVLELIGDVSVLVWLLGSATGDEGELSAIHGSSLERLLERLVEAPLRRFVYEAAGSVPPKHLERGRRIVAEAAERWRIPVAMPENIEVGDIAKLG
jgi:nucleoside-diphosphate-sugar epimerase